MIEHIQGFAGASIIFHIHHVEALGRLRPASSAPANIGPVITHPGYFRAAAPIDCTAARRSKSPLACANAVEEAPHRIKKSM
jgi:hypothetical protein